MAEHGELLITLLSCSPKFEKDSERNYHTNSGHLIRELGKVISASQGLLWYKQLHYLPPAKRILAGNDYNDAI